MTSEELNIELQRAIFHLRRKIEFNESIKCHRVADRYLDLVTRMRDKQKEYSLRTFVLVHREQICRNEQKRII